MKPLVMAAIILGIVFLICAFIYFTTSANSLPSFFPGHEGGVSTHHYKHGIGTLLLGIACFIFAWFKSGKKKSADKENNG
jgi:hypothetical protein